MQRDDKNPSGSLAEAQQHGDDETSDRVGPVITRSKALKAAPKTEPAEALKGDALKKGAPEPETETTQSSNPLRRLLSRLRAHPYLTPLALLALLIVIGAGTAWYLNARQYETSDDAFIAARIVPISSQVEGAVIALPVTDNQLVPKGGVLLEIDQRNYRAALAQAKAQIAQDQANIAVLAAKIEAQHATIESAKRNIAQAKSAMDFAAKQNTRYQDLAKRGAGTQERAEQTAADLHEKQAAYLGAQAIEQAVARQIPVLQAQQHLAEAQLAAAKAQLKIAQANLDRTVITAPVTGYATKITAATGAYAEPGQTMMMFVPQKVWVVANYKETALSDIRVGQKVDIRIDAYPGRIFHGHVASIQAGSGAAFSLLPPENATGNYVKIVQRVPVKITFDKPPDVYVGPGMSVVPSVKVR